MPSSNCIFVSDLHGSLTRYRKLFQYILSHKPGAVFIGGDILPSYLTALKDSAPAYEQFISEFLVSEFSHLRQNLGNAYPEVFIILGNDDGRFRESDVIDAEKKGIWHYCHFKSISWNAFTVYGYSFIPPSPFLLKDWERFDVTDFTRPGCISPLDGRFTVPITPQELLHSTIEKDLTELTRNADVSRSIFLFHSPPHGSKLDRADLMGRKINDIQVDIHVGSAAIQRFISKRQPLLTLHGHIHESTRLTGAWRDRFIRTHSFNASHEGPELSLIRFDPYSLENASRELI